MESKPRIPEVLREAIEADTNAILAGAIRIKEVLVGKGQNRSSDQTLMDSAVDAEREGMDRSLKIGVALRRNKAASEVIINRP